MPDRPEADRSCLVRIVDDDAEFREAVQFSLELAGWRTVSFESAETYLAAAEDDSPGCLLLDIQLTGMSGIELQEVLVDEHASLPILFLTGHGDMDAAIRAFRKGAVDFLQKPIDLGELLSAVARACERSKTAQQEKRQSSPLARWKALTERQQAVLMGLEKGLSGKAAAEHLGISPRTLQRHRQNALRLCGIKVEELADFLGAVRKGMADAAK